MKPYLGLVVLVSEWSASKIDDCFCTQNVIIKCNIYRRKKDDEQSRPANVHSWLLLLLHKNVIIKNKTRSCACESIQLTNLSGCCINITDKLQYRTCRKFMGFYLLWSIRSDENKTNRFQRTSVTICECRSGTRWEVTDPETQVDVADGMATSLVDVADKVATWWRRGRSNVCGT